MDQLLVPLRDAALNYVLSAMSTNVVIAHIPAWIRDEPSVHLEDRSASADCWKKHFLLTRPQRQAFTVVGVVRPWNLLPVSDATGTDWCSRMQSLFDLFSICRGTVAHVLTLVGTIQLSILATAARDPVEDMISQSRPSRTTEPSRRRYRSSLNR